MISLILWIIAPILNAIMDLVENENFFKSIFHREKLLGQYWDTFWYKRTSWETARKLYWQPKIFGRKFILLNYKFDAWHLCKSLMIIFIVLSSIAMYFEGPFRFTSKPLLNGLIDLFIKGLTWNGVFSLFYHKLFRTKNNA